MSRTDRGDSLDQRPTEATDDDPRAADAVPDPDQVADDRDLDDEGDQGLDDRGLDDGGGQTLGRSSLANLVGFGVYGVTSFALVVVLTRRLGTAGAGTLLLAIAVFNIVSRSAMAGTDIALVRFTSRFLARGRRREVRRLYRIALVPVASASTLTGVALAVTARPLADLLTGDGSAQDLTRYLQVLAPFVPVACLYQVIEGGSRGFGTMLPGVVVERVGRSSLLPVTMLATIGAGGGAAAVGLAWAGPFAVALVPMALWTTTLVRRAERSLGNRPPPPLDPGVLRRRFWSFALPRSFAGIFALTITWVDALLLGALEGPRSVGIYTAATRWLLVGNMAGNAVTIAFGPQISAVMATRATEAAQQLFQTATAWLILLAAPCYLAAMVFAPFLLRAFGDGFGAGTGVVAITGAGFLFSAVTGPVDMFLLMTGRSRQSLLNSGVALIVNLAANLALIPVLGIRGAALAWAISLTVANGLPLVQIWRSVGIHPYGPRTGRALLVAAAAGVAMLGVRAVAGATLTGTAIGLAVGVAVVVTGIALSGDHMGVGDILRRRTP